jgi:hypothetical protein
LSDLTWQLEPVNKAIAQLLRRDIRAHRREKGRGGHRFKYSDISEIYAAYTDGELADHILVHHNDDPVWQDWCNHPEDGWILCDWYPSLQQAQQAAQIHSWEPVEVTPEVDGREPGIYVLAGWPGRTTTPIRVHCHSKNIAITIADILRGLGLMTSQETVAA